MTTIDLATLLKIPCVDPENGFDISPDGKSIVFSSNPTGQWEIYILSLDGSTPPRQITRGEGAKFAPTYSPDGKALAYALDLDGGENFDIYVYDFATGEHRNLTPNTPAGLQPNLAWSPDGAYIAFLYNETGNFDLYAVPVETGEHTGPPLRLLARLAHPGWDLDWSPGGERIAVVAEGKVQDFNTWIVTLENDRVEPVAVEGKPIDARNARFSPDGKRLAFSGGGRGDLSDRPDEEIGFVELYDGAITWITSGEGDKSQPCWSPDGRQIAYIHDQGETSWVEVLEIRDQAQVVQRYQVEDGCHHSPKFTPDGKSLFFVFDNPRCPDDLWRVDLAIGKQPVGQITHSLPANLRGAPFVMPRAVRYPSQDGVIVPALLYTPPDYQAPGPAVINIHGGPTWLFAYLWYPFMTHLASRGYLVLAPNYRGSTGYGKAWQLANRFELGRLDAMDCAAGADWLVREGLADPRRIAVTGRSHGGYLTMCCLTQYPERFAAGSAVVPFLNWFTSHKASREDLQHWDRENMGDPVENEALWRERSPFFSLDRIQAPVQMICGANDPRCPPNEGVQARDALLALGKEVELLMYEDEGHGFLKIKNVIDHEVRRAEFLAKALMRTF